MSTVNRVPKGARRTAGPFVMPQIDGMTVT